MGKADLDLPKSHKGSDVQNSLSLTTMALTVVVAGATSFEVARAAAAALLIYSCSAAAAASMARIA